jgi:serine/threonine protein kinase
MFEIGNGAFGKIYYSLSKSSNKEFAVKKINKNYFKPNSNFPNVRWEIMICEILSNIKHKNIIKVIDIYENLNECYVVFEFIKEGLADYISTTWPKKNIIIKILYQLADAVSLLNVFGIIHKDLKISNILLSDHSEQNFNIKLIDFGLSKVIGKYEYLKETTGTLIYISPEVINKKAYNFKEDVWTFGIIAYYLYKHKFPFNFKESILDTPKNIKNYQNQMDQTEIHLEFNKKCDKNDMLIINIINMCLNKQIYFRPYIQDILNFVIKNESIN